MSDQTLNLSKLQDEALNSALKCEWQKAIELNLQILEETPEDTDTMNRLAKAYMEVGEFSKSKKIYQDVLELDPYNTIADKNLKKVSSLKKGDGQALNNNHVALSASMFLEEPGVTTSVNLIKVAEPQKLLTLSAGTPVNLIPKGKSLAAVDAQGTYLGVLPDDLGFHISKLIEGGNKYQALIKSIKSNGLTILIREVFRSKKFRNQASFLDRSQVISYSSEHLSLLNEDEVEEVVDDDSGEEVPL